MARMPSKKTNTRTAVSSAPRRKPAAVGGKSVRKTHPKRTGIVWSVFIGTMTLAGGALLLNDNWKGESWKGVPLVGIATAPSPTGADAGATAEKPSTSGWTQIVVHESGSLVGSLEELSRQHVAAGLPSLGYHLVVGNGNGELNGAVLLGPRWNAQQPGTIVATTGEQLQYVENPNAIEVCLIGDSRRRALSEAQIESLASIVSDLSRHYGISKANVVRQHDRGGPVSFASDSEWARIQRRLES